MSPRPSCLIFAHDRSLLDTTFETTRRRRMRRNRLFLDRKIREKEIVYFEKNLIMTREEMSACADENKTTKLIVDVTAQVNQLRNMSTMIQIEIRENERLGAHIYDLAKNMCSDREQEKYFIFVKDVDKIVNLLLSLTGRLSRVENAIKNLPMDAEKDELICLCKKRKKLSYQYVDAKELKENCDKRKENICQILSHHFSEIQFANFLHYIEVKTALIIEQRQVDEKIKLSEDHIKILRDSLPETFN
ncbi:protein Shroom2-like [Clavelina lepadiformis]|uniref:protein Shroom2-like n=1 Tax=Clavelina lepadiformis TaxID=159417 RepID=UPI00404379D7